jgi:leishmanolysin
MMCSEGKVIEWLNGNITCSPSDNYTNLQRESVIETLNNVRHFISSLLTVTPSINPQFALFERTGSPVTTGSTDGNTDLYITVYPRPFGPNSTTLSNAGFIHRPTWTAYRPVQSFLNINMAKAPSTPQSIDDVGDRAFFEMMLHELFHRLGISETAFATWLDPNTHSSYHSMLPNYTFSNEFGKIFKILHTPKIRAIVASRIGFEYFNGTSSRPVGVELEDNGDEGTLGSHWEGRTYFTELMTAASFGHSWISEISLAALEDTGWYGVNYKYAESLAWGDYRSIRGRTATQFSNFLLGRPAVDWPEHYVMRTREEADYPTCTYDNRSPASLVKHERNCSERTGGECAFPEFYDPFDTGLYSSESVDYALIPVPIVPCINHGVASEQSEEFGAVRGATSFCAASKLAKSGKNWTRYYGECYPMECDDDGGLLVFVGVNREQQVKCMRSGERKEIPGFAGDILCPDPDVVCGIIQYAGLEVERTQRASVANEVSLLTSGRPTKSRSTQGLVSSTWSRSVRPRSPRSSPIPTQSASPKPEHRLAVNGTTRVGSSDVLLRLMGKGVIMPVEGASEINLSELIVDGAEIVASRLIVRDTLELIGEAVLEPMNGENIGLGVGVEIWLITPDDGGSPRLVPGNVTVVPKVIHVIIPLWAVDNRRHVRA